MNKRTRRFLIALKNGFVKLLSVIAFVGLIFCVTAIDTEGTLLYFFGALICLAWLFVFLLANGMFDPLMDEVFEWMN